MTPKRITLLCAIIISLLGSGVIAGWLFQTHIIILLILITTLGCACFVYFLIRYKGFYEEYETLQRLYHHSSLMREMITLLQSIKTLDDACRVVAVFGEQLFPSTAGIVFITDYQGKWQEKSHWHYKNLKHMSFTDNDCWAVRSNHIYEVLRQDDKPLCPHVQRMSHIHYPHLCMPIEEHGKLSGILFVECLEETIEGNSYEEIKLEVETFTEQISSALTNIKLGDMLRYQSLSDPLTGLYNRRYFLSALNHEIVRTKRRKSQFSLVMIDIDHFKKYNDTYGHEVGDRILQKLAYILRIHFRESDIICRYGGEEFIVLLPDIGLEDAKSRCDVLLNTVHSELVLPTVTKINKVTVSIGISAFPMHGRMAEQLIDKADKALYQAKSQGRDQIKVFVEPEKK